jgi:hypothetical protein
VRGADGDDDRRRSADRRGALAAWAEGLAGRRDETRGRGRPRFALYGRVSTEDWQDPVTSRRGSCSRR